MLKVATYVQVLIALLVWTNSSLCRSQTYNICPSINCFIQPCLTLEQFATSTFKNASAKRIKLSLSPGNHSLSSELLLENLSYLSLNAISDTEKTRIICNGSSQLSLFNISESQIDGIMFSECQSIIAMNLKNMTINNCIFFGRNGSLPLLELNRSKVLFKISSFHVTNMRNRSDSVEPVLVSQGSNVTIEASNLTVQGANILLAESESMIQIKNTIISNSTTHTVRLDHPSALIQISNGQLLLEDSKIIENIGEMIYARECEVSINNSAFKINIHLPSALIQISNGQLLLKDSNIIENKGEMIIYARQCEININNSILKNNFVTDCVLCIIKSRPVFFNDVQALANHGNFSIIYLLKTGTNITGRMKFSNNVGSLLIINSNVQFFSFTTFEKSTQSWLIPKNDRLQAQGTLTVIQSTVVFWKNTNFIDNNSTKSGGAIYSSESKITILKCLLVANNTAGNSGGGAILHLSTFICHGQCTFTGNTASVKGGGIHAISSVIALSTSTQEIYNATFTNLSFIDNKTGSGGALYLELNSYLNCIVDRMHQYSITFDGNHAGHDGGAIFIRDETYFGACNSTSSFDHYIRTKCFFQVIYNDRDVKTLKGRHFTFNNNTAYRGSVLYGGLLDRCSQSPRADIYNKATHKSMSGFKYFVNESRGNVTQNDIESDAMRVCSCQDTRTFHCRDQQSVHVQKGEIFNVSIMVIDQVNRTIINATIRSALQEKSFLGEGQQLQHTVDECTNLTFNISSPLESINLTLYADQGPCKDKGLSSFIVNITFKHCNCYIGFVPSTNSHKCECNLDPLLQDYAIAFNTSSIIRTKNCWVNYFNNGSRYMYIIHPNCPYDYCLPPYPTTGIVTLNNTNGADAQCNFNRTGLLCGQCRQGYSLTISSWHCIQCPKYWPALVAGNILIGTMSGLLLVFVFLLINLTVALGTSNGIIFYANIVLINKSIFLPSNVTLNFFTIVIHWLNTQMGIKRCLWEGMTAYGKTWFSYVFPLYMISLVLAIIIISKYSLRCAHLLGRRNPVATLATLILFSYAYFLRSILNILSFTVLKYPDGNRTVVWLPDASVKYFQGKHIPLFLSAIILATIGLAYTILLFSWQWLHRLPNIVIFQWLRNTKLNSFIEAYHAPYKPKYRYWTGLLLLICIVLSVAITANVSGDPQYNLLATGTLVTILIMFKAYLGENIYKNKVIDYLENTCYLNLLLLTLATFYSINSENVHKIVTHTSFGVTLILSLCVITYHTYSTLRKMVWCQKLCTLIIQTMKKHKTASNDSQHLDLNTKTSGRCLTTEVSMTAMATRHGKDEMTEKKSEKAHEAVVRTIEQEAYTSDSLIEPLL